MELYLRLVDSPEHYSNAADYPDGIPFEAPEGLEWVEGKPPQGCIPYVEPVLADQLNAIFEALPAEAQADLAPLKAAVKLELDQNHLAIARLIIERAAIPEALEPLRVQMLSRFPE